MADDKSKKPKIDLKARLGKPAGAAAGAAVPLSIPGQGNSSHPPGPSAMPSATPSQRPSGIAPPPGISAGISPGIPLPPFGQQARRPEAAPKPVASQQTIKVEVGEEIHEERRKASKRTALYAVIAAGVGIGLGFVAGGAKERSDRGGRAVVGVTRLKTDVQGANGKMKELSEKLVAASEKLRAKEFPVDLAKDLAAVNVPFDANTLDGKDIGGLPPKILKPVLNYTSAVEDLNKTKDSLRNLVGLTQPRIEKFWKEEKDPVAGYSVKFSGGTEKMLAELVPNKEPFAFKGDFPESYTILIPKRTEKGVTNEDKKVNRFRGKGDLTGNDHVIPLDSRATPILSGEEFLNKLNKAIYDVRVILEGNQENPQDPEPGLLKTGEDLVDILNKAAMSK